MPGTVLLLAASPAGKGCLVDAASVLPVLAAVAPPVLSGTDTANVVELADPLEPQAVLTRLRAAAAVPGPLTVFLVGQLQLDRREHLPHLALARTTPSTVRYTAFPWHWLREELRLRPPGQTTVFADLHADAETWRYLRTRPLDCGRSVLLYGRVAPPPPRRALAAPAYMKAVATILRSGHRPDPTTLHHEALTRSLAETGAPAGTERDVVLGPVVNSPAPYGSWHTPPAGYTPHPGHPAPATHPEHPAQAGHFAHPDPLAQSVPSARPEPLAQSVPSARPEPLAQFVPSARPEHPEPSPPVVQPGPPAQSPPPGQPADARYGAGLPPAPRTSPPAVRLQAVAPPPAAGTPTVPPQADGPGAPDATVLSLPVSVPSAPDQDPHTALAAAVQDGRHAEAEALAERWEQTALREHGAGSEEVLHWTEVRADLAMLAGDPGRSCETWLAVAAARLSAGQRPEDPAVEAAVDRAHHQWGRLRDTARARELGPGLAELRKRVPGRREGALDHVHRRLRRLGAGLQTQP
ncbi:hypothetical protein [Streptomyces gibsoniae]|uniref:Uncharacterized protein n=1 Tax=Streptomyces gibsoniae TaxID=3075529 RepID=A0ABU2TQA1_9ACTN|nr:hypothetical protein [Streptomyces sp. DSM 41699]MDT0463065.1 hypothetical protein [Streptomyces sp. DSM 41699]